MSDPLQREVDLPFQRTFHPFGFRLNLASNSSKVLDAAAENWGMYDMRHPNVALTVRVLVAQGSEVSSMPVHRSQNHLYSIVGGRENYAVTDFDQLFAYAWVTEATVADRSLFSWCYLDAMVGSMLAQRQVVPMHAACVERNGAGVLLSAPSGMGKSTLSYACARAGWTFVADDATLLPQAHEDGVVTGKPHQARFREDAPRFFPEFDGYSALARPMGKLSIEIPVSTLSGIRAAAHSRVKHVVFLDRGKSLRLERIDAESALEELLRSSTSYGTETYARHETALRRLLCVPAYRLRYELLADAMTALEGLTA